MDGAEWYRGAAVKKRDLCSSRRPNSVNQVTVNNHETRTAVVADRRHLVGCRVPVERHDHGAGLRCRTHDLQLLQIVAHDHRHRHIRARPEGNERTGAARRARIHRVRGNTLVEIRYNRHWHVITLALGNHSRFLNLLRQSGPGDLTSPQNGYWSHRLFSTSAAISNDRMRAA